MDIFKIIKSGLSLTTAKALLQVIEAYGYTFSVSYRQIGNNIDMTYENVRYHFKKLERAGLISIEHSSSRRLICVINKDKVNELFNIR